MWPQSGQTSSVLDPPTPPASFLPQFATSQLKKLTSVCFPKVSYTYSQQV